ncbi:hypothetical protein IAT38_005529 [Cryptococcus sp. DSM 104549]
MPDIIDLFNSPPSAPPPRLPRSRSRSGTPGTPPRPNANGGADPLFFSPGASIDGSPRVGRRASPARGGVSLGGTSAPGGGAGSTSAAAAAAAAAAPAPAPAPPKAGPSGLVRIRHSNLDAGTGAGTTAGGNGFASTSYAGAFGGWGGGGGGLLDGTRGAGGGDGDEEEEEGGRKKKRAIAKVDADRLLSERGIPALCRAAKKFKVLGKGREKEDLRNVLNMYQLWAHGMFPKGDFAHTMLRVETECRSRRMESAMKGFYDAFHPRAKSPTPPPPRSPSPIRSESASPVRETARPEEAEEEMVYGAPDVDVDVDAGAGRKEPLFSAGEEGDYPDLDELLAMEEMEREGAGVAAATVTSAVDEFDEFDGLYD